MKQDGTLTYDVDAIAVPGALAAAQSGWYVQGVWQFMPRWRVGYRYDALGHGTFANALAGDPAVGSANLPVLSAHDPTRHTVMTDWSPTEFSRIRLQYAADKSRRGTTDHQIVLQYIYSLGQHGAHRF
jgi:hypothetical protein